MSFAGHSLGLLGRFLESCWTAAGGGSMIDRGKKLGDLETASTPNVLRLGTIIIGPSSEGPRRHFVYSNDTPLLGNPLRHSNLIVQKYENSE